MLAVKQVYGRYTGTIVIPSSEKRSCTRLRVWLSGWKSENLCVPLTELPL